MTRCADTRAAPEDTQQYLRQVRAVIAAALPAGSLESRLPLITTEWGYCTACNWSHSPHLVSETMQGAYLLRMALSNAAVGVRLTTVYCLTDGPDTGLQPNSYGLLRRDCDVACVYEPKVAYSVAKTLASVLKGDRDTVPRLLNATYNGDGAAKAMELQLHSQPSPLLVWLAVSDPTATASVTVQLVSAPDTCFKVVSMTGHATDHESLCTRADGSLVVPRASAMPLYLFPSVGALEPIALK
jgi:hypothetical protein